VPLLETTNDEQKFANVMDCSQLLLRRYFTVKAEIKVSPAPLTSNTCTLLVGIIILLYFAPLSPSVIINSYFFGNFVTFLNSFSLILIIQFSNKLKSFFLLSTIIGHLNKFNIFLFAQYLIHKFYFH